MVPRMVRCAAIGLFVASSASPRGLRRIEAEENRGEAVKGKEGNAFDRLVMLSVWTPKDNSYAYLIKVALLGQG